jgi:hypothetical protein
MAKGTIGFKVIGRDNIKLYILTAVHEDLDSIHSILKSASNNLFADLWGNIESLRDRSGMYYDREATKRFVTGAFSDSTYGLSPRIIKIFDELTKEGKIARYPGGGFYYIPHNYANNHFI